MNLFVYSYISTNMSESREVLSILLQSMSDEKSIIYSKYDIPKNIMFNVANVILFYENNVTDEFGPDHEAVLSNASILSGQLSCMYKRMDEMKNQQETIFSAYDLYHVANTTKDNFDENGNYVETDEQDLELVFYNNNLDKNKIYTRQDIEKIIEQRYQNVMNNFSKYYPKVPLVLL